ncbi:hypothetical protein MMC18_006790 [Xylographa bjoerkii]|nr:hypothetical protein [Xylographa bjoerkii]
MQFQWPRIWIDNFNGFNYHLAWQARRRLVIKRVEDAGFGWWIVIVAGVGFLANSYDIFAVNTVVPMLNTVYYAGQMPPWHKFALNCSTLVGAMFGQITLGIMADKLGRKKVYGFELLLVIMASVGFAATSTGVNNSMSIIGWLSFWRFCMGCGIGADYPLSSVITSEFAPTRYRGRMVAAVFFWQSVGQLLATLFAYAATKSFQAHISSSQADCSIFSTDIPGMDCAGRVDQIWRLVAGLGAAPAAIAMAFRFTIPESAYWVLDVKNDSNQAYQSRLYWPASESDDLECASDTSSISGDFHPEIVAVSSQVPSVQDDTIKAAPVMSMTAARGLTASGTASAKARVKQPSVFEDPNPREQSFRDFWAFFMFEGNWTDLFATSFNWMLLDFTFFLLGVNSSTIVPSMFSKAPSADIIPSGNTTLFTVTTPSTQDTYLYLLDGEWQAMVATSIGAVVGGAIAIKVMNKTHRGASKLKLFGDCMTIYLKNNLSRKDIQTIGFLILAVLFPIVGALYVCLGNTSAAPSIVVFYVLCQLFYNLGPNTTTFIIPAEAFPTRYRCTCHGISAACGKLGSVLGQLVITELRASSKIGYLLISFVGVMLVGATISQYLTPETCDIWGNSRPLEDLSLGKRHRQALRDAERKEEREKAH